jgi:hypothetical protein
MQCGIKAALRDLVRRSWFWLRPEENDDVDQGHTRSRIGNCCHKRPTGICWKLACAVQPKPGLQPLSWGEHVLVARPLWRRQRIRLEALDRCCSGGLWAEGGTDLGERLLAGALIAREICLSRTRHPCRDGCGHLLGKFPKLAFR